MSFSSYDALIAAITSGSRLVLPWQKLASTGVVANNWYHMWPVGGAPSVGAYTGTSLQWQPTGDTTAGSIYHGGNVSSATKHLIYAMAMSQASTPLVMLVDQVGYYPLTQSASPQSFDNSGNGAPGRYVSAGQPGLQIMLVASGVGGAGSSTISTLTYVNQGGSTHTMPTSPSVAIQASAAAPTTNLGARVIAPQGSGTAGAGPFLPLAAGDSGVQSLTNITFASPITGNEALVLCKPLFTLPCAGANIGTERDLVNQIVSLERIYDGACLSLVVYCPATPTLLIGEVHVAWG